MRVLFPPNTFFPSLGGGPVVRLGVVYMTGGTSRFRGRRADVRSSADDIGRRLGPAVGPGDRARSRALVAVERDVQPGVERA